jgi:hypothetical protein
VIIIRASGTLDGPTWIDPRVALRRPTRIAGSKRIRSAEGGERVREATEILRHPRQALSKQAY